MIPLGAQHSTSSKRTNSVSVLIREIISRSTQVSKIPCIRINLKKDHMTSYHLKIGTFFNLYFGDCGESRNEEVLESYSVSDAIIAVCGVISNKMVRV